MSKRANRRKRRPSNSPKQLCSHNNPDSQNVESNKLDRDPMATIEPTQAATHQGWDTEEREHKRQERRHWSFEKLTTGFTLFFSLIAGLGAVAGVCIAYRAFLTSIEAVNEAKRQAKAAEDQIEVAKDTERRQLRAYVMVESSAVSINADGLPVVRIAVKNFGSTPAYDFRHWACAVIRKFPDQEKDFLKNSLLVQAAEAPKSLIAPGGLIFKDYVGVCDRANESPVLKEEIAAVREGSKEIFTVGVIKYRDAFRVEHVTHYRRAWNEKTKLSSDGYKGNCADEDC